MVAPLEGLVEATRDISHIDRSDIYYHLLLSYCEFQLLSVRYISCFKLMILCYKCVKIIFSHLIYRCLFLFSKLIS
jgi:hypothetical protein